jgi:phosphoglycerol transferase MdoB-like AlkP superfamily enzyme
MNSAEYYSRGVNYENWGYDHYYGLKDLGDYKDNSYNLDRELMLNEKFTELMFPKDNKFVDYIITYSGHTPFTNTKGVCKQLYDLDIQKEMNETGSDVEPEFIEMTEEECIRRQNTETDYMMELLLQRLKDNNILNDTVIVVITDHYLYTVTDMTILDRYKNTSNNLINNTPFFIWTNKTKKTNINAVTSQIDVLPTILNLFGFEYNVNNYLGKDALANKYKGIVFFNDYSWYDGNVYVENGSPINDKKIKEDDLIEKNEYVNYSIKKNDLTLKYNYLK